MLPYNILTQILNIKKAKFSWVKLDLKNTIFAQNILNRQHFCIELVLSFYTFYSKKFVETNGFMQIFWKPVSNKNSCYQICNFCNFLNYFYDLYLLGKCFGNIHSFECRMLRFFRNYRRISRKKRNTKTVKDNQICLDNVERRLYFCIWRLGNKPKILIKKSNYPC